MEMRWVSTLSRQADSIAALDEAAAAVRAELGGVAPDLVLAFVSPHHRAQFPQFPGSLRAAFPGGTTVMGCSAGGVIGLGQELEGAAGLSLTAAVLPLVERRPFHVDGRELVPLYTDEGGWAQRLALAPADEPCFILLPDPFSCDLALLLRGLDAAFPNSPKVGGLASGGVRPGSNALFVNDQVFDHGAVGLALTGNVELQTIVAQGCRPIGAPQFVTRAAGNLILELDGRPPLEVMEELFEKLQRADQELFSRALHIGLAMNRGRDHYGQGDFVVRNILGIDAQSGALAVGAHVEPRLVVQFQLRDARASAEDLQSLLSDHVERHGNTPPHGALLFSCVGRGQAFFGRPNHDTDAFQAALGPTALGGFFCNGELGPVQGRTYLHGYTSAFGLFRPRPVH
jgi:small ligand-binding sensory domain FIST